MKPVLTSLWLNKVGQKQTTATALPVEIRLDWSNDRHHAVAIELPCTNEQVFYALERLAQLVIQDRSLD